MYTFYHIFVGLSNGNGAREGRKYTYKTSSENLKG